MRIRPATPGDLPALQDVERAAGAPFRDLGMPEIADDDPPTLDELERYRKAGRCWVAADEQDRPTAYLTAEPVDGALHVEQVSVHPRAARRGVGRTLLAHAAEHARERDLRALTLTTFTEVPWNAPYYARLGFRVLSEPDLTPGLRRIRAEESAHGLDQWPRVCMRLELPPAGGRPPASPWEADPGPLTSSGVEGAAVDDRHRAGHAVLVHEGEERLGRVVRLRRAAQGRGRGETGVPLLPVLLAHPGPQRRRSHGARNGTGASCRGTEQAGDQPVAYLSLSSILRTLPETVIGKVSRSSRRLGTL